MTCKDCQFANEIESETAVECRRFPPKVYQMIGSSITSPFPLLAKDAWCGEYRKRVNGKVAVETTMTISRGKHK